MAEVIAVKVMFEWDFYFFYLPVGLIVELTFSLISFNSFYFKL